MGADAAARAAGSAAANKKVDAKAESADRAPSFAAGGQQ